MILAEIGHFSSAVLRKWRNRGRAAVQFVRETPKSIQMFSQQHNIN
jgi:hypothetical protein